MSLKRCSSCGATVEVADHQLSTICGFCESPLVAAEGTSEPVDRVVTFSVERQRASDLLKAELQGRWFAPESVRKAARPDELHPLLVPFYAVDAIARSTYHASVGIYWYRTETYTTTENGKTVTKTRQVRETEWHGMSGTHGKRWFDHLVSASVGLPEAESNALEPFDLGASLPYSPALLAGVQAECPTVDHAQAHGTAHQELANLQQQVIGRTHLPGDTHRQLQSETTVELSNHRLVLLPVWSAVYPGPKGPIRMLVNGQTGEVVGTTPTSWAKVGGLVAAVIAVILVLFFGASCVGAIGTSVAAILESL